MMRKNHSQPFLRALAAACALLFCGSAAAEDAAVRAVEFTFPSTLNRAEAAVFCYTFEAPANTLNPAAHDGLYGVMFSHHLEVILSRMKLLQGRTAMN